MLRSHIPLMPLLLAVLPLSSTTLLASERPPHSVSYSLYPSAIVSSGGVACGSPHNDLIFFIGEGPVGLSNNSSFSIWTGLRIARQVSVLCPQPSTSNDLQAIVATTLHPPLPNPSASDIQLSFDLAHPSAVDLAVYDVQGRRVVQLLNGPTQVGHHTLSWHGQTSCGVLVPNGIYFLRLQADNQVHTRRLVFLR